MLGICFWSFCNISVGEECFDINSVENFVAILCMFSEYTATNNQNEYFIIKVEVHNSSVDSPKFSTRRN